MITKKYFEQIKGQLADLGDDESEKRLVGDHCCPDCGAPQLCAGKANGG